jgi:hypothetical protein
MARRRMLVAMLAILGAWGWASGIAAADTTVVVKVDIALAAPSGPTVCDGGPTYPTCTTPYEGHGVSVNGLRGWQLSFTIVEFRPCIAGVTGTWQLAATDGSGDGLSGGLSGAYGGDLRMEVTAGTGAYAGYVDAVPGGATQSFRPVAVPTLGVTGCGAAVILPVYNFSLEFHLQPASA